MRALFVALAAAVAVLGFPGTATPAGYEWQGQFNPAAALDLSQVEVGPPVEVDCWDDASCAASMWRPHPDLTGPDGTVHTGCEALPPVPDLNLPEQVVCNDGYAESHTTDHTR